MPVKLECIRVGELVHVQQMSLSEKELRVLY